MAAILIMEDEAPLAEAWAELLKEQGHSVQIASNGYQAYDLATAAPVDLLITDILVRRNEIPTPEGGVLLIGRLRTPGVEKTAPWVRGLPIIAVSGVPSFDGVAGPLQIAERLGANIALEKPIAHRTLLEAVEALLARRDGAAAPQPPG